MILFFSANPVRIFLSRILKKDMQNNYQHQLNKLLREQMNLEQT